MLRAIAVIMALCGGVLAGCSGADRLRRRSAVLSEVRAAVRQIRLGLAHTNRPVTALLSECGGRETQVLFCEMARGIGAGNTPMSAWEQAARDNGAALAGLTEGDRKTLSVFFSLLGGSDRCSQLQHADATLQTLSVQCAEAKHTYEKNGRVYRTMGILLGVGAAILLL